MKNLLHRPALEAILTLATSDERWPSRAAIASECGFTPSTLSNALAGRSLSDAATDALCCHIPGLTREALILPALARPGDLETVRLIAELRALRTDVNTRVNDVARAIQERSTGG